MTSPEHARSLLATAMNQAVQTAIREERTYEGILAEQAVKDGEALGFIDVNGGEETVTGIQFPIKFLEKPVFTPGLELPDNVWLSWGKFPQWSAAVASWQTEAAGTSTLFTGCTIGVVLTGVAHAILHYRFAARSYTNPVTNTGSVTSVL